MWYGQCKKLSIKDAMADESLCLEAKQLLKSTYHISSSSDFRTYVIRQTTETLINLLEYLERNDLQRSKREILKKELEYRSEGTETGDGVSNFRTYTGRLFSEEWEDIQRAAYLIRHPKKKPRTVIRFYYSPKKTV